jgi:mannose-6-phosphate isomerase class I
MTSIPGQPDTTSGSPDRESRRLRDPLMRFNLLDEIARVAGEPEWGDGDRNSIVLAKGARFRLLLTVLRDGAQMDDDNGAATLSVQVITGSATIGRGPDQAILAPGELAVVEAGSPWTLTATGETAVLTTLAWPEDRAGV